MRFEEFRRSHRSRERLPEDLWAAAAEIAQRRGLNITARALRLDIDNLRKRMGGQVSLPKAKRGRKKRTQPASAPAAFLELLAPAASAAASCVVEVESVRGGKLRMELKGLGSSEIAQLHILAEVVSRAYSDFADHLDRRPRSADPNEDMASMGKAYLEYAQSHPLQYRLMFETQLPDPREHPEMMRRAEHASSLLREAIARLPARPGDAPVDLDALFVWSVMHGLAGILGGDGLGSPGPTLESAVPFALWRIGLALGARGE
jgi:hypothetical protein